MKSQAPLTPSLNQVTLSYSHFNPKYRSVRPSIIAATIHTIGFIARTPFKSITAADKALTIVIAVIKPRKTIPQTLTFSLFLSTHSLICCIFSVNFSTFFLNDSNFCFTSSAVIPHILVLSFASLDFVLKPNIAPITAIIKSPIAPNAVPRLCNADSQTLLTSAFSCK